MRKSLIGWVVLGITALVWELLGVFGVGGVWPLTWLVRDAMDSSELGVLGVCLACVGFPAWLVYHFLVEPRKYGNKQ